MRTTMSGLAVGVLLSVACGGTNAQEPVYFLQGEWALYASMDFGDPAHNVPAAVLGQLYFTDAGGGHAEMGPDYGSDAVWTLVGRRYDGISPEWTATYSGPDGQHVLTATMDSKSTFVGMLEARPIRGSYFGPDQQ